MRRERVLIAAAAVLIAFPSRAETFFDALTDGRPLLDVRLRYDTVDESDKPRDATATTVRARAGYETGDYLGFTALAEADVVQHIGPRHFNDTVDGLVAYPVIADPDMVTLNRLQLAYEAHLVAVPGSPPDLRLVAGRQEIVLGNQRFIGNAAWRQHEQTFDAVSLSDSSLPGVALFYSYVARVNRPFGPRNPAGHFDSDTHLFNAVYTGLPHLRIEGYVYMYDFRNAPTLSTANFGLRATTSFDLGSGFGANLDGEFARQTDRANNPLAIALDDYRLEGGLTYRGVGILAGYEVSQGNGTIGFQTPLVSGHLFQGWDELFVVKPPEGLKDVYVKANYTIAGPLGIAIVPTLIYHQFSAQHIEADYGSEWDAGIGARIDSHLSFDAAYADHRGAGPFPAKREMWLYATYRL